jgi:hypothetical protein
MMRSSLRRCSRSLAGILAWGVTLGVACAPWLGRGSVGVPGGRGYGNVEQRVRTLADELYKWLPANKRALLSPAPVVVDPASKPFVGLGPADAGNGQSAVRISAGFLDLANRLAHAKAISGRYYDQYVVLVSQSADGTVPALPAAENPRYWTESVLNEQVSNFNQLVGTVVAIEMYRHYSGMDKKYASRLQDASGTPACLNDLLTPEEWDKSFTAGVHHALEAGLGIEGAKYVYEAIDREPVRADWTLLFLPRRVKYKGLKKQMERLEKGFFGGEE